ncbi:hypothetical protein APA_4991 [Pseudanabaena sp. lw0831]|nr:hypothetical protein APA_4991 [Pseudanabaena sp. lw0831]
MLKVLQSNTFNTFIASGLSAKRCKEKSSRPARGFLFLMIIGDGDMLLHCLRENQ